ncbi:MAG: DUF5906 domain-containing protein [bacterium]
MNKECKNNVDTVDKNTGEKIMNRKIRGSINTKYTNKEEVTAHKNRSFTPFEGTLEELSEVINQGHAFCVELTGNNRCEKNFKSADLVVLDFDGGATIEEIKNNDFIKQHAGLLYTTPSHPKNGEDRFRVILPLEETITSKSEYKKLLKSILKKFPQADQSCSDATRFYYGCRGSNPEPLGGFLSKEKAKELIDNYVEFLPVLNNLEKDYNFSKEDVEKMLTFVDPMSGYEVWRNVTWAVQDILGDEAFEVIENWSPDYKHGGKDLKNLLKSAVCRSDENRITIKTLLWYATKNGYKIPSGEFHKLNPGHVALKYLFNEGLGYITVAGELYEYYEGYYHKINEHQLKSVITHFFDGYFDDEGQTPLAFPRFVDDAYKYILRKTYVEQDEVNPTGINAKNGYLQLSYDENNEAHFEIVAHSPEYYFTYRAEFDYNPKASSTIFDKTMDDMLDKVDQEILFRVLGSSFDLPEMRKRHTRAVKLLMLYGQGSNGKDTLKEWIEQLYAGHGITALPLQAFKNADGSGREFSLSCLATSKVNWSSENAAVALDTCQTLKNFVTGDSMKVEEKYKSPMIIKPKAIGIFNINELPYLESTSEAITSRYGIIQFKYSFVDKPEEERAENEKQANPKLKEDKEYVRAEILPALLNRLIEEFKNALKDGIDYSANDSIMLEVRESNSHLFQYIQDASVELCKNNEKGISPSELFEDYRRWCALNGIVELGDDHKFKRALHDNKWDKPISSVTEVTKRFKKFFPTLQTTRDKGGRFINLKISNPTVLNDLY